MDIKLIQKKLNDLNYGPLEVDGLNGKNTINAIKKFQKDKGLESDGIVGPNTLSKLFPPVVLTSNTLVERALDIAISKNGVREATGKNDGVEVEKYLASVGLGKGYS